MGASGSGKSTYGQYVINELGVNVSVFNGDQERIDLLQNHDSSTTEKMLSEKYNFLKNDAIGKGLPFAVESPWPMIDQIKEFKAQGYKINAVFFGLDNPDECNIRINHRAMMGGLDIAPESVRHIYIQSFDLLSKEIKKGTFDHIYFMQNQNMIAEFSKESKFLKIFEADVNWFNQKIRWDISSYLSQLKCNPGLSTGMKI